jgi:hypothetical protein
MIDQYARATDVADAVRQIAGNPSAKFVAGGTNLIDLMKMEVERPCCSGCSAPLIASPSIVVISARPRTSPQMSGRN